MRSLSFLHIHYLYVILHGQAVTSLSCNDGYFLDSNRECVKCPDHCQFCESKKHCLSCENGYWGDVCERVCATCKDRTSCEKSNGFCLEDCNDGLTGVLCDAKCSDKCSSCSRTDAQNCSSCAVGRYPPVLCNISCPSSCYNEKCNATGFCTFGCANGAWGQKCEKKCSGFCKDSSCFQDNGTCIFGCGDSYTGTKCDTVKKKEEWSKTVVIVVPIVATVIILALVVTLVLWFAKKGTCTRARFSQVQKSFTRRFTRRNLDTENPDEIEKLNKEATEKIENENKASNYEKKTEAGENIQKTAFLAEANLRQRAADVIFRCKTLVCCASERRRQTPEELSMAANNETELNAPEEKKKTREEKLQELVDSIQNKTDEDYKNEFKRLPTLMRKSYAKSQKKKNRSNVEKEGAFPYDENRVIVRYKKGKKLYVNASHIKVRVQEGNKETPICAETDSDPATTFRSTDFRFGMDDNTDAYIALAGPRTEDGYERMWMLLLEYSCKTVVMFKSIVQAENESYWPDMTQKIKSYDTTSVKYKSAKSVDKNCVVRIFEMGEGSRARLVKQFQYTGWPEKSVPTNIQSLVAFLDKVKAAYPEGSGPLVVHGRCGVGRTGTFIALHMLSNEVENILDSDDKIEIDIYSCVERLRQQRINMVENWEQYKFLHEALSCYIVKRLENMRKNRKTQGQPKRK